MAVSHSLGKGGEADVEKTGNRIPAVPDLPCMGIVHTLRKCVLTARLHEQSA